MLRRTRKFIFKMTYKDHVICILTRERTYVCIVLKTDEKSMNMSRTVVPDVCRRLEIKLNRVSAASSIPLLVLYSSNWIHAIGVSLR